jgi:hypothetical protein
MMVQSGMCVGHVCSAYGCAIQPRHWTSNHHLHSTLNHPSPCLPPILHADANLSSRSPYPCKGIPPASKHPWLFIPRESASHDAHAPRPTYLWPLLWKLFQAGCCVERSLRKWLKWIHQAGSPARHKATHLAFQAEVSGAQVRFDMDSIPIGIDNHASQCMANNKCLFEDLHLDQAEQQVGGINDGLVIAGQGTMVITINDDSGRPHKIKIPNSLFLPDLRVCLLLSQHWAQEARDNHPLPNGTRMETNATNCMLIWGQGKF